MHTCCCTNQCKTCGQCCQVGCACRFGSYTAPYNPNPWRPPVTPVQPPMVPIQAPPLTEEQVRKIIREEIERGR